MDIDTLAAAVNGPVLRPGDEGFDAEIGPFNLVFQHTPEVVVGATSAADIAAAVRWAAERSLPLGVQATGHGPVRAVDSGVLISTKRMTGVTINPATRVATIEAGVRWRELLDAGAQHGLGGLCGSTSGVGVVGYTLGGGLPVLGRAFGFACDYVRRVDLVTPDGEQRTVDMRDGSDLAWALRGGRGNFGVVTSMEIDLLEIAELYGGAVFFDGADARAVLTAYAAWSADLPDEFCSSVALLRLPPFPDIPEPLRGRFVVHLRVAYLGDADAGARLLAPMRDAAPIVMEHVGAMPYAALDQIHMDPHDPVPAIEGGLALAALGPDTIETLLEQAGPDTDCPFLLAEVRHMGGRLARSEASAIAARDAAYHLFAVGVPMPETADAISVAKAALLDAMRRHSPGTALPNFQGPPRDDADRDRAWGVDGHQRLRRIKAQHDPQNLLRFGYSLQPATD